MNVYDFDKTIYDGDSTLDFWIFCVKKKHSLIKYFPLQIKALFDYKANRITKVSMKEIFFYFLNEIEDIDKIVSEFWSEKQNKIKEWYFTNKKQDDIIISASPEFLLEPIINYLGIELIASRVNKYTGTFESENCYGDEKVLRFSEKHDLSAIDNFYSDSTSDFPMAICAKQAFLVKGNRVQLWKIGSK